MIGPFRSYIKCRKPQNVYFYKTALSRRLLRFHQPGDVVYAQTMVFFLPRFINLCGATISQNKLTLDDIINNKEKFQELPQQTEQSMINEVVPICKLLPVNPAIIAAGKGPFRQLEG